MADSLRAFWVIAGAWVRVSWSYRLSFLTLTVSGLLLTGLDFAAIVIIFGNLDAFGGFTLAQIAVLYGISGLALGATDLLLGNVERFGQRIRDGSFDLMLVRPVRPIVQVAADRFQLRRIGRICQSSLVLGWALTAADIDWSVPRLAVLILALGCGVLIFSSIMVLGGAFQVYANDAAEVTNAFTYGGNTVTQYPLSIYPPELVKALTFVLPLAFVNWYPALFVLGIDDPFGLPGWLRFASPVAAAGCAAAAWLGWRTAISRYRSTGS